MATFEEDLATRIDGVMADDDYLEMYRRIAWSRSPGFVDLWDDAKRDFVIPSLVWPASEPDAWDFLRREFASEVRQARGEEHDAEAFALQEANPGPTAADRLRQMVSAGSGGS